MSSFGFQVNRNAGCFRKKCVQMCVTILFTDKWITCLFKQSLSDTYFNDCQILYIQYLMNRWPYLNLCLLRELPLFYSSNNKLKRLTVQMLQPTRSLNMAVTYIPHYFSISSSSSCTVFSAFLRPASLHDLGESHPVQQDSLLSLYPNHSHKCICIQQKQFSSY